jgi:hypothetical protein
MYNFRLLETTLKPLSLQCLSLLENLGKSNLTLEVYINKCKLEGIDDADA